MAGQGVSRRRFLQLAAGVGAVSAVPGVRAAAWASGPTLPRGTWLAGDFHVHTVLSHDVWSGPHDDNTGIEDAYTWGWTGAEQIRNAELRGLDFVALTDHDRVDVLHTPQYKSSKLTLVPGYEHSLNGGHAGIFMRSRRDLPTILTKDNDGTPGLERLLAQVHERNGIMVMNHPYGGATWRYDLAPSYAVDAIEVWNSQWLQRDPVSLAVSNNHIAIAHWESDFLGTQHRKAAVGGSDNHWRSTFEVQGVGQPTTWVYAANRTPGAILDGVLAGRTTVSWQPPVLAGPRLRITATELYGDHNRAMVGGEVGALGPAEFAISVANGLGHRLRVIASGEVIGDYLVDRPSITIKQTAVLRRAGWLRAELYVQPGYVMTAVTSPVYAGVDAPVAVQRPVTTGPAVDYGLDLTIPVPASSCCGG
jgi:hypothetical protein